MHQAVRVQIAHSSRPGQRMLQRIVKSCLQRLPSEILGDVELDPDPYNGRHRKTGIVLEEGDELADLVHGEVAHAICRVRVLGLHDTVVQSGVQNGDCIDAQRLEGDGWYDGFKVEGLTGLVECSVRIIRVLLVRASQDAYKVLEAKPSA